MQKNFSWTASLGRWSGVPVRLHLFFLLFAALIFGVQFNETGIPPFTGLATVVVLFLVVLFRELAQLFATVNLGGHAEELVITPWGGHSKLLLPVQPKHQMVVFVSGIFFNLALFSIGAAMLTLTGHATLAQLTNPLRPQLLVNGMVELSLLKIATWINFQILMVQLLPCFPFDMYRIVRAAVLNYNPDVPRLRLESMLMGMGIIAGLAMFVAAWFLRDVNTGPIQPTWLLLVGAGTVMIFSARYGFHEQIVARHQPRLDVDDFSEFDPLYEEEEDYLEDYEEELYSEWLNDHQAVSENIERSVEQEEDKRVDRILDKLHQQGIDALTEEERSFLNRISLRYRRRRQLRS